VSLLRPAWHEVVANVAALYDWLEARGDLPDDVSYFLHKPWKWTAEWERMQAETTQAVQP
jgi:hypothetical protein